MIQRIGRGKNVVGSNQTLGFVLFQLEFTAWYNTSAFSKKTCYVQQHNSKIANKKKGNRDNYVFKRNIDF